MSQNKAQLIDASLESLNNVSGAPTDGQTLIWNATSGQWEPSSIPGVSLALAGLTDVGSDSPSDGQALVWNATAGQWEPGVIPSSTLAALSDVAATAPSDGQALVWNATASQWEPGTVAAPGQEGLNVTQSLLDSLENQFNGATTTFSLLASGEPFTPQNALALEVILGGVQQEPGSDYTVSGDEITFSTAPVAGLNCTIIGSTYSVGGSGGIAVSGTPSDGQVLLYNATSGKWEPAALPTGPEGPAGSAGAAGASAYQVALSNGFVGTEQQWLSSLVGPAGVAGSIGPSGQSGSQGPVGPGVPSGGTAGQVLVKVDGADYNTQWSTAPSAYTDEQAQDAAGSLLTSGSHTGITFAYDDSGNKINATVTAGNLAVISPPDPSANSVVLLMHAEGGEGSTNFTDSSNYANNGSATGTYNTTQTSIAQKKFGSSSAYITWNGWGSTKHILFPEIAAYDLSNKAFTVEGWFYFTSFISFDGVYLFEKGTNSGSWRFSLDCRGGFVCAGAGLPTIIYAYPPLTGGNYTTPSTPINSWHHIAWVCDGTNFSIYWDGTRILNQAGAFTSNPAGGLHVGGGVSGYYGINGYIDEVRITSGVARYTDSSFALQAAPFSIALSLPSPSVTGQAVSDGDHLYVCTASGSPGTWKKVALTAV